MTEAEFRAAQTAFSIAPIRNDSLARAFNNRGNAYVAKGQYDRAIEDFDQAIKLNPSHANAFNNRGVAKAGMGDKKGADADLAAARRINANVGRDHYVMVCKMLRKSFPDVAITI